MANYVFIATSIDGFIADENGGIDWLHEIPNPTGNDYGYNAFIESIDALVMGRNTYSSKSWKSEAGEIMVQYEKPANI